MPILMGAKRVLLLSGTPALARPVELWAQLHCIDKELFGTYTSYTNKYCAAKRGRFGWDVSGLSNAEELHKKLKSVMIRRLKCDVLKELPAKQRCIVPVTIPKSEHIKECKSIMSQLNETRLAISTLVGEEASDAHFEARKLLMQAYQSSGIGKAQSVAEYVLDWLRGSGTQKVLVFAHHKEVLDTIESVILKNLKGVAHIRIDGSVPSKERASRVKKFQNNPNLRLGLLSVTAAGVGLTLTAASSVIFAELHWTPGILAQAEDRCHRIGQVNAVNVMFCVCKDTELSVDMSLWKMLGRKVNNIGRMVDGEKGASMNAINSDNSAPSEQELSAFFAESCPDHASGSKLQSPVKGSIQSFFCQKRSAVASSMNSSKFPKSVSVGKSVTPEGEKDPFSKQLYARNSYSPISASLEAKSEKWDCELCTFSNKANARTCDICGQSKFSQVILLQESTQCPTCTYLNENVSLKCAMCQATLIPESGNDPSNSKTSSDILNSLSSSTDSRMMSPLHEFPTSIDDTIGANKSLAKKSTIIELNDDSDDEFVNCPPQSKRPRLDYCLIPHCNDPKLSFSVSKNSGRVAIHDGDSGSMFPVNFDFESILDNHTSEQILERQLKRGTICASNVLFNEDEVFKVAQALCKDSPLNHGKFDHQSIDELCSEIKVFVSTYISLREVEKRSIQQYPNPIKCHDVKNTLRKIATDSMATQFQTTERYCGGRKEEALKNLSLGIATDKDHRIINGESCAWCGKHLTQAAMSKDVESTYCSQECAEEGRLRRGGMYASTRVRAQVFSLENGICQKCGIDANALYLKVHALEPPERLNALMSANWRLPKTQKALHNLLHNPKEADFWQADHILPVAQGGGDASLDNYRTLCTPCHLVETERLTSRLKLLDANKSNVGTSDIRDLFAKQQGQQQKKDDFCKKTIKKYSAD
eukprot:CAMPEP_0176504824 /NCGR_PEP_ID=MMETSP0200_2-20121128/16158_1 /TAXON_ID=947934 /ORGANISM="Chaetoceros sp., Strain GSL56" /LENGTH=930 /DNA_ID=CAMNT_0017904319 /DNA_START=273 /DNA_END=3065 /DNA_ORIENTATION=+